MTKRRGFWLWLGIILLSLSAVIWLGVIGAIATEPGDAAYALLAAVITTPLPIGFGIYCLVRARRLRAAEGEDSGQTRGTVPKGRGVWLWLGITSLSIGVLFWLVAIIGIATGLGGASDAIVGVVVITALPIGFGIYCLMRARRRRVTEERGDGQITATSPQRTPASDAPAARHRPRRGVKMRLGAQELISILIIFLVMGVNILVAWWLSPSPSPVDEAYNILEEYYVNQGALDAELKNESSVADMLGTVYNPAGGALQDPPASNYTYYITPSQYVWLMEYFEEDSETIFEDPEGVVPDNIAYIVVTHFSEGTGDELITLFEEEISIEGLDGIILDLRDNGGGVVDSAAEVADQFLAAGTIFSLVYGDGSAETMTAESGDSADDPGLTLAVLINGNTASAAEIVAAALGENGRATLIGTSTYGKGFMGYIVPLRDGSAISVTSAYWYTPTDFWVEGVGLSPDPGFWVEDHPETPQDEQLQAAIAYIIG